MRPSVAENSAMLVIRKSVLSTKIGLSPVRFIPVCRCFTCINCKYFFCIIERVCAHKYLRITYALGRVMLGHVQGILLRCCAHRGERGGKT